MSDAETSMLWPLKSIRQLLDRLRRAHQTIYPTVKDQVICIGELHAGLLIAK